MYCEKCTMCHTIYQNDEYTTDDIFDITDIKYMSIICQQCISQNRVPNNTIKILQDIESFKRELNSFGTELKQLYSKKNI